MSNALNIAKGSFYILKNKCTSLIQNPEALKSQSLILASLVLVISRILVANFSAIKARGTKDGPYRYRESIRTDIREIAGFTFGFLVLRQLQSLIKKGLGKVLGVVTLEKDPNHVSIFKSFKTLYSKPSAEAVKALQDWQVDLSKTAKLDCKLTPLAERIANMPGIKSLISKHYENNAAKFMLSLHKIAPILLASIPTIALAGYGLERFTRDHSNKVVDVVSRMFNRKTNSPTVSTPITKPQAFAPATPITAVPAAQPVAPVQFGANRFAFQNAPSSQPALFNLYR